MGSVRHTFLSAMDTNYLKIWMWASFARDIGIILGVPIIIAIVYKLFRYHINIIKSQVETLKTSNEVLKQMQEKQINTLEAENKLLKETQYDKALAIIEAQKKLHKIERDTLEKEMSLLISEKAKLEEINKKMSEVYTSADEAMETLLETLSKKGLKHLEAESWEDFLDMADFKAVSGKIVFFKPRVKKQE